LVSGLFICGQIKGYCPTLTKNVIHALQRLEDSVLRIKEEIFWFWCDLSADKNTFNLLSQNKRKAAYEIWASRIKNSTSRHKNIVLTYLNQAILVHSSVIGKEMFVKYDAEKEVENKITIGKGGEIVCPKCLRQYDNKYSFCLNCGAGLSSAAIEKSIKSKSATLELDEVHWKNWRFAWNRFLFVNSQEAFWAIIKARAKKIGDPRLKEDKICEIRDNFLTNLLEPNLFFISQALTAKHFERVKQHSSLINGISLPPGVLKQQLNCLLSQHITSLDTLARDTANGVKNIESKASLLDLYSKLCNEAENLIYEASLVDLNYLSDFSLTRDNVSKTIRDISVETHNRFEDYEKAYEILEKAVEFAGTSYQKQGLQKDLRLSKKHVDFVRQGGRSSISTSGDNSKKNKSGLIAWAVIIGFFIIVSLMSDSDSNGSSSANYQQNRSSVKTRINELKQTIESKERRLSNIIAEGERLVVTYENRFIPDYVIEKADSLDEEYAKLRLEYEEDIVAHNRLVEFYNK